MLIRSMLLRSIERRSLFACVTAAAMGLGAALLPAGSACAQTNFSERPAHLLVPYPAGARTTVLVNGVIVVENAVHSGALPGKVLRRDAAGKVG